MGNSNLNTNKMTAYAAAVMLVFALFAGAAAAKSVYLSANHHTSEFDAWNIYTNGTIAKQDTYTLQHSTDPAGIGIDAIPEDAPVIFITSEASGGVEIVNPITLEYMGISSGPSNLAGVAVDDADNIVYTLKRQSNDLYIYSWDPVVKTLTELAVIDRPSLQSGCGLALDDSRDVLWVSDTPNSMVRAYDVNVVNWDNIAEIPSLSQQLSLPVIDVAVDSKRNIVYAVGAWANSDILSKYDVTTGTESTINLGVGGIGVAVDEDSGYVYITRGTSDVGDDIQVWDTSTNPFTLVQDTPRIGNPAGICISTVAFNPLNLTKEHGLTDCVRPGDSITYTICYDNMRNPEVHGVTIVDDLPADVSFTSATNGGTYDSATHTVTWDIGTIPARTSQQCVQLVVTVDDTATSETDITNSITISGDEPGYTGPTTVNAEVCVDPEPTPTPDQPPADPMPVPVLTLSGAMLLVGLLAMTGFVVLRRRQ
ncbi:MAG: hypothetical protein BA871_13425 [Desulfuromonadales bacterium C00003096]|nr:MAG: hypothetical protein BA871_13425 [Desulfuromonadales bacterium C00003096]